MSLKNRDEHNRWRNKTIEFRVSPEENKQIERYVQLSGLTKQDYIVKRLLCRDVVVQGNPRVYKALKNQLAEVLAELKRIENSSAVDDELLHEFDGVINLYDSPGRVHHKLRQALEQTRTTAQPEGYELSEREREILVAVARGLTNREIADQYFISIHTVISHRKNITRKTGIKTIAGLTVYALLNNMISEADLGN